MLNFIHKNKNANDTLELEQYHQLQNENECQQPIEHSITEEEDNKDSPIEEKQNWKSVICLLIPLALFNLLWGCIDSSLYLLLPLYTAQNFSSNADTLAGIGITCLGFSHFISLPFMGYCITHTSVEFMYISAIIIRSIFFFVLFIFNQYYAIWIFVLVAHGCTTAIHRVCLNRFYAEYIKHSNRGRFTAAIASFQRWGAIIGPFYAGHVNEISVGILITSIVSISALPIFCLLMFPENVLIRSESDFGSFLYLKDGNRQLSFSEKVNAYNWIPKDNEDDELQLEYISSANLRRRSSSFLEREMSSFQVLQKYYKLIFVVGMFCFCLSWVRATRKLVITFKGNALDFTHAQLGTLNSVSYIVEFTLVIIAGYVVDRYGRKASAIPGFIFAIIALTFIGLPIIANFSSLLIISIIFGFADGITTGLLSTVTADISPIECRTKFIALFRMTMVAPTVIAPTIIGALSSNVSVFSAAIISSVVGWFGLFWIIFVVKKIRK